MLRLAEETSTKSHREVFASIVVDLENDDGKIEDFSRYHLLTSIFMGLLFVKECQSLCMM